MNLFAGDLGRPSCLVALYMSSAGIIEEHSQGNACWCVHLQKTNQQLLQLLVHHADSTNHIAELCIMCMGTSREIISIQTLKNNLDHSLVRSLLFMHAISGCDTTSRPYGIGKVTVLSKYAALSRAADVFLSAKADKK